MAGYLLFEMIVAATTSVEASQKYASSAPTANIQALRSKSLRSRRSSAGALRQRVGVGDDRPRAGHVIPEVLEGCGWHRCPLS
jgi:hypothetical protein